MAAAALRTVFAQPDVRSVHHAWDQVADHLAGLFPKTGEVMDAAKAEVLAFADFPKGPGRVG